MSKKLAHYVPLHAKPDKEVDLEGLLKSGLPLVENEPKTSTMMEQNVYA